MCRQVRRESAMGSSGVGCCLRLREMLSSLSPKGDGEVKFGKLSVRVKKGDFYKVKK